MHGYSLTSRTVAAVHVVLGAELVVVVVSVVAPPELPGRRDVVRVPGLADLVRALVEVVEMLHLRIELEEGSARKHDSGWPDEDLVYVADPGSLAQNRILAYGEVVRLLQFPTEAPGEVDDGVDPQDVLLEVRHPRRDHGAVPLWATRWC